MAKTNIPRCPGCQAEWHAVNSDGVVSPCSVICREIARVKADIQKVKKNKKKSSVRKTKKKKKS